MDPAVLSAVSALAGSLIGASASVLTSWSTQRLQHVSQQRVATRTRREALYAEFITEASQLFARALGAERPEPSDLVTLMALVNRIRLHAEPDTIEAAMTTVEALVATFFAPPIQLEQLRTGDRSLAVDPLRAFSELGRAELTRIG